MRQCLSSISLRITEVILITRVGGIYWVLIMNKKWFSALCKHWLVSALKWPLRWDLCLFPDPDAKFVHRGDLASSFTGWIESRSQILFLPQWRRGESEWNRRVANTASSTGKVCMFYLSCPLQRHQIRGQGTDVIPGFNSHLRLRTACIFSSCIPIFLSRELGTSGLLWMWLRCSPLGRVCRGGGLLYFTCTH